MAGRHVSVAQQIRIREAVEPDAFGTACVEVDGWRATYQAIMPNEVLAQRTYEVRERYWAEVLRTASSQNKALYVAEGADRQIIGFGYVGPERQGDPIYRGELYGLYVLPEYQRRGIGQALTRIAVDHLATAGIHSLLVWVLAANPYRRFYEKLGGNLLRQERLNIGGRQLESIAYGWPETRALRV